MMFQDVVIVIPAYEPDDRLLELLKNIRDKENQMFDIILVDDGSGADFAPLFAIAQSNYACHLQRHADNKGKGRALKTAISYILDNFPNAKGIVTIDSDGQHTYEDMMKCGSLSTVVGDEKLTSREDRIGPLFMYVQSDEDTLLKVDEVSETKS